MRSSFTLANTVVACCAALLLGGCFVEEDAISIRPDGTVKFESLVTVADAAKKFAFADVEKTAKTLLDELREHRWTVSETWLSKERPYQLKVTGEGKLAEVTGGTRLYSLTKVDEKLYRIHFGTPGSEADPSHRRIVFSPMDAGGKTGVYTPDGKPVTQIDAVVQTDVYSIVLPAAAS
jgi:hypothetical protein